MVSDWSSDVCSSDLPIWMEYELIGLVEEWINMGEKNEMAGPEGFGSEKQGSKRSDWTELCKNTSLDEGDIVRKIGRASCRERV